MHQMRDLSAMDVIRAVEQVTGVEILPRTRKGRQSGMHGLARRIAAYIMREYLGMSCGQIARYLRLSHPAGLRYARQHAVELEIYPYIRELTERVLARLVGVKCNDDAILQIQPRTPIGEALLRARRAYLEAGGKLLGLDELEEKGRE